MEKDLFKDDSTIPVSNWFNFEKVGDFIQGELVDVPFEKEGKFGGQTIYAIKVQTVSGELYREGDENNVPLKHTIHKMNIQQLKRDEDEDIVGFRLKELVDTGKGNPAKSIEVRLRKVEKFQKNADDDINPADIPF